MEGTGSRSPDRLVAGRYRLTRMLGRGGMGWVWRATDELIGREVAVKELRAPDGLSAGERTTFEERALREARTAGRINHPGVVGIYDLVPATGNDPAAYIVMELVEAPSLADVLEREGALPEQRVVTLAAGVLDALKAAHAINLVHRDIKPGNIMVLGRDKVKLVDFGIAHAADDTRLTRHGVAGSLGFIAPELFDGKQPSAASDLWAVGVTLYQAASGLRLFERASTAATVRAILQDDAPPLERHPLLAPVVAGLLVRDPSRRMTGSEASAALRADGEMPGVGTAGTASARASQEDTSMRTSAGRGHAEQRAAWEEEATKVRTGAPRARSSRTQSSSGAEAKAAGEPETMPVTPPGKFHTLDNVSFFVLISLIAWAAWRVFHVVWDWGFLGLIPAGIAVSFIPHALTAWWGGFGFDSDGTHIYASGEWPYEGAAPPGNKCLIPWKHVDEVVLVRRPQSRVELLGDIPGGTRIYICMSGATPDEVRRMPPFAGSGRTGIGSAFTWCIGESDHPARKIENAVRAAAPRAVTLTCRNQADSEVKTLRYQGPRRPALAWGSLALAAVIAATYIFYHSTAPVRLADSGSSQIQFSPGGEFLAGDTEDHDIGLWDVASRKRTATLSGLTSSVTDIQFNDNGDLLAGADDDGAIQVWNTLQHSQLTKISLNEVVYALHLDLSPDNKLLASVNSDHTIVLWDTYTGAKLRTIDETANFTRNVNFDSGGQTLSGLDGTDTPHTWDVATGRTVTPAVTTGGYWAHTSRYDTNDVEIVDGSGHHQQTLAGHTGKITGIGWAADTDQNLIATSSEDSTIRVWNASTGETEKKLTLNWRADAVALSPDGTLLAYGTSVELRLWKTGISS